MGTVVKQTSKACGRMLCKVRLDDVVADPESYHRFYRSRVTTGLGVEVESGQVDLLVRRTYRLSPWLGPAGG